MRLHSSSAAATVFSNLALTQMFYIIGSSYEYLFFIVSKTRASDDACGESKSTAGMEIGDRGETFSGSAVGMG